MQILANTNDFTTSLEKALYDTDPRWMSYPGLIIAGSHNPEGVEEKIEKIKEARWNRIPFFGICFGMQLMAIEYARTALGKIYANSTEIDPNTNFPIVVKLNDPQDYDGQTARRVGMKPTLDIYGNSQLESFWHNYKVNNEYLSHFVKDWKLTQVYDSSLGESIVDYMVYKPSIDYGVVHMGVQFHPEYQSSKDKPHWALEYFLNSCKLTGRHH